MRRRAPQLQWRCLTLKIGKQIAIRILRERVAAHVRLNRIKILFQGNHKS